MNPDSTGISYKVIKEEREFAIAYQTRIERYSERRSGKILVFFPKIFMLDHHNYGTSWFFKDHDPKRTYAELDHFFPFGIIGLPPNQVQRKGIGSRVLQQVIDDCMQKEAAFLLVETYSPSMIGLLKKFDFNVVGGYSSSHYVLPLE